MFLRCRFFTMRARMASSFAAARATASVASFAAISATIWASTALILSFPQLAARFRWDSYSALSVIGKDMCFGQDRVDPALEDPSPQ